mmetsp:Transcript_37685/g.118933  ORF Transcript_37685/g.118933 Transcript_37685/m.118933 type:complete len:245 (-) Transcript_37685:456-1190(-)
MAEGLGIKPGALVRGLNIVAGAQHQVVAITRDIIRDADNLSLLIHEILPPAHLYELLHLHRGRGGGHHVGLVEHEGGSGGEEGAIGVAEVLVVHLTIHDGAGLVGVHGVEVALGIRLRHHALRERGLGEANTLHGHLDTAINRVGVASRATGHLHHVRRSPWDTGVDVLGVRGEVQEAEPISQDLRGDGGVGVVEGVLRGAGGVGSRVHDIAADASVTLDPNVPLVFGDVARGLIDLLEAAAAV